MGKKKTHGQEDPVQKIYDESSDNKAYNSQDNSLETEKSNSAPSNENGTTITDPSYAANTSSDKVVMEGRSAEEKLAEMQDKYIRLSAEFDNYRKRTLREKMELSKYAGENILIKILPVMDDFERALAHIDAATDCDAIKNGIDLIFGKFTEFLKLNGVSEIDSLNCDFNVDLHDAVAKTPVPDENKKGKIVDVIQKGYYLQDKVIRHSKVVIGE